MNGETKAGAGIASLDQAIAILGQINILIPIGYTLGKSLAEFIRNALNHPNVPQATKEEALAACEAFSAASANVRQTAETWLDTHPAEPDTDQG